MEHQKVFRKVPEPSVPKAPGALSMKGNARVRNGSRYKIITVMAKMVGSRAIEKIHKIIWILGLKKIYQWYMSKFTA